MLYSTGAQVVLYTLQGLMWYCILYRGSCGTVYSTGAQVHYNRDMDTDLGGGPVDPALSAGVHVDQHQAFHQGRVVQLGGRKGLVYNKCNTKHWTKNLI